MEVVACEWYPLLREMKELMNDAGRILLDVAARAWLATFWSMVSLVVSRRVVVEYGRRVEGSFCWRNMRGMSRDMRSSEGDWSVKVRLSNALGVNKKPADHNGVINFPVEKEKCVAQSRWK